MHLLDLVHRSILCSIGPGNFCKPGIFKWTLLSNLRMWSINRGCVTDTIKEKFTDIIFRFLPIDISSGIYNRIRNGKSIS